MPLDPTDAATTPQPVGPVNADAVAVAQPPTVTPAGAGSVQAPDISGASGDPTAGAASGQPAPPPSAGLRTGLRQGFMGRNLRVTGTGKVESGETTAPTFTSRLGNILGTIALGALGGLGGVEKGNRSGAIGAGFRSSQELFQRREALKRQQAQQQFENQQKATALKGEQAVQAAEIQHLNADTAHVINQTTYEAEAHPLEIALKKAGLENAALSLQATRTELLKSSVSLMQGLAENGIDPSVMVTSWDQAKQFAPDLARGKSVAIQNGVHGGEEHGAGLFDVAQLRTTTLSKDVTFSTWHADKNGAPVEEKHTIKAGTDSAYNYMVAAMNGKAQLSKILALQENKSAQDLKRAETQRAQAETGKAAAETRLTDVQIKNMENLGVVVPANFQSIPNGFSMQPAELRGELEKQGVRVPNNFESLYAIAHYKAAPGTLPARTFNKGGNLQMDQQTGLSYIRAFINPGYDENNFKAVQNLEKEAASTRQGTMGGNLIAFNTATGHLGQLYDAAKALQNNDLQRLNALANQLGVETGKSPVPVFNAIRGALVGELGRTFKGAAPDIPEMNQILETINSSQSPQASADVAKTYAHLMLTKAGAQVAHYYAWTGDLPPETIQPAAADVYRRMGIDIHDVLPQGAQRPSGQAGSQNQPQAQQTPQFQGQRQGEHPMMSADGKSIVGYSLDGGKTMRKVSPFPVPQPVQ